MVALRLLLELTSVLIKFFITKFSILSMAWRMDISRNGMFTAPALSPKPANTEAVYLILLIFLNSVVQNALQFTQSLYGNHFHSLYVLTPLLFLCVNSEIFANENDFFKPFSVVIYHQLVYFQNIAERCASIFWLEQHLWVLNWGLPAPPYSPCELHLGRDFIWVVRWLGMWHMPYFWPCFWSGWFPSAR